MLLQVDRFLAFNALSHADVQQVFQKLLMLENTVRCSLLHACFCGELMLQTCVCTGCA
jgi:hypothetical protein